MIPRLLAFTAALTLVVTALSGCAPEPTPSPSATSFATEDEAFAAAEETYRAYVDALNQVDLSDPETFEAVYAWTTGELNATDRKNFSSWHASEYSKTGDALVTASYRMNAHDIGGSGAEVELDACYAVSAVDVMDASGESIVAADRPDTQQLSVRLVGAATPTTLAISSIAPSEGELNC